MRGADLPACFGQPTNASPFAATGATTGRVAPPSDGTERMPVVADGMKRIEPSRSQSPTNVAIVGDWTRRTGAPPATGTL